MEKTCSSCKETKTNKDFYPYTKGNGEKGLRTICIKCDRTRAKLCLSKKPKSYFRTRQLKYWYGIDLEEYNRMFAEQEGCCKICKKHQSNFKRALAVDHCHTTLEIRGLLCGNCNKGIGSLQHDITILKEAINYLENQK